MHWICYLRYFDKAFLCEDQTLDFHIKKQTYTHKRQNCEDRKPGVCFIFFIGQRKKKSVTIIFKNFHSIYIRRLGKKIYKKVKHFTLCFKMILVVISIVMGD